MQLASDDGLRPIDSGPLRCARELEAMALLHMQIQGPLSGQFASAIQGADRTVGDSGTCPQVPAPQPRSGLRCSAPPRLLVRSFL